MNTYPYTALSAGDMSSATLTSSTIELDYMLYIGIQCVFTGAPVGTLQLNGSVDNITFSTITGTSVSISAAGDFLYNVINAGYRYINVTYTKTSGTGSLTIKSYAKGF